MRQSKDLTPKPLRLVFFDTKPYDRTHFDSLSQEKGIDKIFSPAIRSRYGGLSTGF